MDYDLDLRKAIRNNANLTEKALMKNIHRVVVLTEIQVEQAPFQYLRPQLQSLHNSTTQKRQSTKHRIGISGVHLQKKKMHKHEITTKTKGTTYRTDSLSFSHDFLSSGIFNSI